MWLRSAEAVLSGSSLKIRHGGITESDGRLRAALLRRERSAGGANRSRVSLSGLAFQDVEGRILWGWPDASGRIRMRPGDERPEVSCLLPAALSLALALRRSDCDLGAQALVLGDGFAARMAGAVAAAVGCRVLAAGTIQGDGRGPAPRPAIVVETSGEPQRLAEAVERCRDWGLVLSLGDALGQAPFDYYAHVHRRALTLVQVPDCPVPTGEEEDLVERVPGLLAAALGGLRPAPEEVLEAEVLPEGAVGRAEFERSGWGLLLVEDR